MGYHDIDEQYNVRVYTGISDFINILV